MAVDLGDIVIHNDDSRTAWQRLDVQADAIVTSPPYWGLRDYGVDDQLGLEATPDQYVTEMADLLTGYGTECMKPDGSLWLNLGDTYAAYNNNRGSSSSISGGGREVLIRARPGVTGDFPAKCLLMIPERVTLALIERGWILRNKVVWAKPDGMPSSVKDRLATKWEYVFHLVRQPRYYYDLDAIREPHTTIGDDGRILGWGKPATTDWRVRSNNGASSSAGLGLTMMGGHPNGKNPGDVWQIPTHRYPDAHFAVYPPKLIERPILATVPEGGTVLDPFFGSGTTGVVARKLGRKAVGVELNPEYVDLAAARFSPTVLDLGASA